ncbi:MAG: hypothetical protein FWC39_09455 [Bacteroidetes bacterium]|nr:hypothetical protein [Bacteroidota bacterium]
MAQIAGLTADRTATGRATYIRLDVRKHGGNQNLQRFFDDVGFEVKPIKWTAKMKKSFAQSKNGEVYDVDMDNFWNI